jgi:hypothetical protein
MIHTPPFYLYGETGKAHGLEGYSLEVLGVSDAVVTQRSLAADELTFSQRAKAGRVIPDDGQWLTLKDDTNTVLMTGIAKRTFNYKARTYSFVVSGVYQGMAETDLIEGDRPFVVYDAQDLGDIILDILARGVTAGLAYQLPATMPDLLTVPKMAFRAQSIASALEDALKWAPHVTSRMDYSTTPPTIRFYTRSASPEIVLDLDSEGHGVGDATITPYPEARALSVSFAYARRDGDNIVNFLVQTAGDDTAEARRKFSLYLSGQERSDMLVTEALTTAQKAVAMAQASVDAVGASIDAAAASAQIPLTWAALVNRESNLAAAVTAQPGFSMSPSAGQTYSLYTGVGWPPGTPWVGYATFSTTALALRTSGGSLATGWYPIVTGSFSDAELLTAGATKETRYITGDFNAVRGFSDSNAGMNVLTSAGAAQLSGWTSGWVADSDAADAAWRKYVRYNVNIAVDAINMAPAAVAAAVKAAAGAGSTSFIERAEFVEAPPDLAANYFASQDWTPQKGPVEMLPSAPVVPSAGEFLSIRGVDAPADWEDMKAPIAARSINLQTLAATLTLGPSPRMDFSSLVDRLRIPTEDNYQAG